MEDIRNKSIHLIINSRRVERSTLLELISFFIGLLILNTIFTTSYAQDIKQFNRLDFVKQKVISKKEAILLFNSGDVRFWIFKDLVEQNRELISPEDVMELAKEFNEYILPEFDRILGLPPFFSGIDIIFDDIRDEAYYRGIKDDKTISGFYSPKLLGKNTILLDMNYQSKGLKPLKSALAHEFTHYCQNYYDPNELDFVNEGIAKVFEQYLYSNFHRKSVYSFLRRPTDNLIEFNKSRIDYAHSFLFFSYLNANYGGKETIARIVRNPQTGIAGVNEVIQKQDIDFNSIFEFFSLALRANTADPIILLNLPGINNPTAKALPISQLFDKILNLQPYSSVYFEISSLKDLDTINSFNREGVISYYVGETKKGNVLVQKTSKGVSEQQFARIKSLVWVVINPSFDQILLHTLK